LFIQKQDEYLTDDRITRGEVKRKNNDDDDVDLITLMHRVKFPP